MHQYEGELDIPYQRDLPVDRESPGETGDHPPARRCRGLQGTCGVVLSYPVELELSRRLEVRMDGNYRPWVVKEGDDLIGRACNGWEAFGRSSMNQS